MKIWRHTSTGNTIQQKENLVPDSKPRISTVYAILVIDSNVLSVNILEMFVTDIRKEFYEVVANQVRTNSLASPVSPTTVEHLVNGNSC